MVESYFMAPVFIQRQHEWNWSIRYCWQNWRKGIRAKTCHCQSV